MPRSPRLSGLLVFVLALALPSQALAAPGRDKVAPAHGRAIVGVKARDRAAAEEAIEARGGHALSYHGRGRFFVVDTPYPAKAWARTLRGDDSVRYVEPDYLLRAEDTTPNDPRWNDLWGLKKVGMPKAWDTERGSESVVVGIIDTGVDYTHQDLGGQMWTNPDEVAGNGADDDGNGFVDDVYGADCANNDGNPKDDNNHGTHVAGTIGAATNNGIGVAGINWNIDIMALKFLGSTGSGYTSDAIECLDYAIAEGAHITSNSWGSGTYSQAMRDAIGRARNAGQLFVAAAGNDASSTDALPHYPSSYDMDNVVSVAATGSTDALASFSNYGVSTVDLGAPGVGIWSTVRNNGYASFSGTSMATPHVSGAAALVMAAHPGGTYQDVLDRLYGSVDPVLAGRVATGGRLNVARAVEDDLAAPGALGLAAGSTGRTSVSLSWTAPEEDGALGGTGVGSRYELSFAPDGTAAWASAPAPAPAAPGTLQATTVSGLRPETSYVFRLIAQDNAGNATTEEVTASTGSGRVVFADDAEPGTSNWSADSPWAITAEHPHSLLGSWSDSPNGSYSNSRDASVRSAVFSLAGATDPRLTFWHRYNLEPGYDFIYVYGSSDGGASWSLLFSTDGHLDRFQPVELGLGTLAGSSNVRLRFRLKTDSSVRYDGWFFDDVIVSDTAPDAVAPDPPTGLSVTDPGLGGTLDLDWDDNAEPDMAGYRVERTTDPPEAGTRTWSTANAGPLPSSAFTDTGLVNGTTYHYRVIATDTSGNESLPSDEQLGTPTGPDARSYAPGSVTLVKGVSLGDPIERLQDDDAAYYRLGSVKKGGKHIVEWQGTGTIDVAGVDRLTVTYDGSYTRGVAQTLSVYRVSTGSWQQVASATVSTADQLFTWSTTNPGAYIGSGGVVRMRVIGKASAAFTANADLMRFTVEY